MTTRVLRLGRFQTEALLGEGGATQTYRARLADAKPGVDERRFVVTLLRAGRGRVDAQVAARFVEAARRLAGLDQSGFVRVVELCEGPGQIYAACEFKAGVNLAQLRSQAAPSGSMDPRLVGLLGGNCRASGAAARGARKPARARRAQSGQCLGVPRRRGVSPGIAVWPRRCGLAATPTSAGGSSPRPSSLRDRPPCPRRTCIPSAP